MKKTLAALTLAMVMMVSSTFANGGIIVFGLTAGGEKDKNPCTQTETPKDLGGIIVSDFGGIIVFGLTGIIVSDIRGGETVNCGIIVSD